MRLATVLIALSSLSLAVPAQTTYVVDMSGGPGSHFIDIQPAVNYAKSGDTICVRPGMYRGFSIVGKGLAVAGETDHVTVDGDVRVESVPAAAVTTLRQLTVSSLGPPGAAGAVLIGGNAGAVHVEGIKVLEGDLRVTESSLVTFHDCAMFCGAIVRSSNVQFAEARFVCDRGAGLLVQGGVVSLQSSIVIGGPAVPMVTQSGPGLEVGFGGRVTVSGRSILSAGAPYFAPVEAIRVASAKVILDPDVLLNPNLGAPATTGMVVLTRIPAVEVNEVRSVGPLSGITRAPAGSAVGVLVSLPTMPLATVFGDLWLSSPLVVVDQGVVGVHGMREFLIPLATPAPPGVAITFQAFALMPPFARASTPSTIVLGL